MLAVFQSVIPIFALILFGVFLRRTSLFEDGFWRGLDRLGFYILYPVLLFVTIVKADFSGLSAGPVMIALLVAWAGVGGFTLALWPILERGGMSGPTFSSVFQTAVRWNGFIALAVAEKAFGTAGAAMVALVMAAVIIPINMSTVIVMSWFTQARPSLAGAFRKVAVNPLIIGAALALLVRQLPFPVPGPLDDALHLIGRSALGMGLIAIGGGLKGGKGAFTGPQAIVPTVLKLVVLPSLVVTLALAFGLTGEQVVWLALCAAVPTAMNGYVLAREMGGDAEAYAATATLQTALSFVTIPTVLAIAGHLAG